MTAQALWGSGSQLDSLQIALRSVFYFFFLLALVRLGGVRIFSRMSSFDNIVMIVLGAVAARGITGPLSTASTIISCVVIVFLHRVCASLAFRNAWFRRAAEGHRVVLYRSGSVDRASLERAALSEEELRATLRIATQNDSFECVEEAALETNGKISFITK